MNLPLHIKSKGGGKEQSGLVLILSLASSKGINGALTNKNDEGLAEKKRRWETTGIKPSHIKCYPQCCSDNILGTNLQRGLIFFKKYFLTVLLFLNGMQLYTKFYNILSEGIWAWCPWYSFIANFLELSGLGHLDPSLPLPTAKCSGEPTAQRKTCHSSHTH